MSNDELAALATKYETHEFLTGDPSWFMHQVEGEGNIEAMAFIASALSYGSRKQFLPKIQYILDKSEGEVERWLTDGTYRRDIPATDECYYRLYTCRMMHDFLAALAQMIVEWGSMKAYVAEQLKASGARDALDAVKTLTKWFAEHGSKGVIPCNATSSCKRICMFLRWMVRSNSPVDVGLWSDIIDRRTLIMPMDTHVVQESNRLGLIASKSTSMSSALKLTDRLREVFPDDPVKADFALFGMGVEA